MDTPRSWIFSTFTRGFCKVHTVPLFLRKWNSLLRFSTNCKVPPPLATKEQTIDPQTVIYALSVVSTATAGQFSSAVQLLQCQMISINIDHRYWEFESQLSLDYSTVYSIETAVYCKITLYSTSQLQNTASTGFGCQTDWVPCMNDNIKLSILLS